MHYFQKAVFMFPLLAHRVPRKILVFFADWTEKYFTNQSKILMTLRTKPLGNIEGKGENAGYQHFLLFPQGFFLPCQRQIPSV